MDAVEVTEDVISDDMTFDDWKGKISEYWRQVENRESQLRLDTR
jgi:hypothetical protein